MGRVPNSEVRGTTGKGPKEGSVAVPGPAT